VTGDAANDPEFTDHGKLATLCGFDRKRNGGRFKLEAEALVSAHRVFGGRIIWRVYKAEEPQRMGVVLRRGGPKVRP